MSEQWLNNAVVVLPVLQLFARIHVPVNLSVIDFILLLYLPKALIDCVPSFFPVLYKKQLIFGSVKLPFC